MYCIYSPWSLLPHLQLDPLGHLLINRLRLRQNGRHFKDAIFKCIFLPENVWILINISLKFVPEGRINNIAALVQIIAWCWPGNKSLSEPIMYSLLIHKCVTLPQWVNDKTRLERHCCQLILSIHIYIFVIFIFTYIHICVCTVNLIPTIYIYIYMCRVLCFSFSHIAVKFNYIHFGQSWIHHFCRVILDLFLSLMVAVWSPLSLRFTAYMAG